MSICSAFGCFNRTDKNRKKGVAFHRFPQDEELKKKWIKAVRRKDWVPSTNSLLCTEHFAGEYVNFTYLSGPNLSKNAVPTIFPNYPSLQPNVEKVHKPPSFIENHDRTLSHDAFVNEPSTSLEESRTNEEPYTNEEPHTNEESCTKDFSVQNQRNCTKRNGTRRPQSGTHCAVVTCHNSSGKARFEGKPISFHRFPANVKVRKEWIHRCKRVNFSIMSAAICSEHFDENDFERDLQNELLGGRIRKMLKKGVVPHLNLPNNPKETEAALARKKRYELRHLRHVRKQHLESALSEYEAQKATEASSQNLDTQPQASSLDQVDQGLVISSVFSLNENPIGHSPNMENTPLDYEALFNELLEKHVALEDKLFQQNLQRKALMIRNKSLKRKCLRVDALKAKLRTCKNEINELRKLTKGNTTRRKKTKNVDTEYIEPIDYDDFSFVIPQADIEIY